MLRLLKLRNKHDVAHVVSSLQVGGAERFVIDLCQAQKKLGFNPIIFSFGSVNDELVSVCAELSVSVYCFTGHKFIKLLTSLVSLYCVNIYHCHSPYPLKFISRLLVVKKPKKIIYTRHGANPLNSESWVNVHKILEKYVDAVTFVSQEGQIVFHQNHGWKNHTSRLIDNGVNFDLVTISKISCDKLRIGSVGRMVELKNQLSLLKAAARLPAEQQAQLEIHFFGDGPCQKTLQQFAIDKLELVTVIFHGMVSDRNIIYNGIDVLAVTSETEGLSLAIMEAMAYQCPVIASDVGGNSKLVSEGDSGWLFEYNNIEQLSNLIALYFDNSQSISAMGRAGAKTILEHFSLDASAKKYESLYKD